METILIICHYHQFDYSQYFHLNHHDEYGASRCHRQPSLLTCSFDCFSLHLQYCTHQNTQIHVYITHVIHIHITQKNTHIHTKNKHIHIHKQTFTPPLFTSSFFLEKTNHFFSSIHVDLCQPHLDVKPLQKLGRERVLLFSVNLISTCWKIRPLDCLKKGVLAHITFQ